MLVPKNLTIIQTTHLLQHVGLEKKKIKKRADRLVRGAL